MNSIFIGCRILKMLLYVSTYRKNKEKDLLLLNKGLGCTWVDGQNNNLHKLKLFRNWNTKKT